MLARLAVLVRRSWLAVVVGLWLHQLALALLSPIAGSDWTALLDAPALTTHGLVHAALCRAPILDAALTPVIAVALALGIAALALRRWPDGRDPGDAAALLVASTLVWVIAPRAGLVYAHRATAAAELYGACAALYVAIAFTALVRRPPAISLFVAGIIAGATPRHIGTVLLCAMIANVVRTRSRAAWFALAGVAIGCFASWYASPAVYLESPDDFLRAVVVALRLPIVALAACALVVLVQLARNKLAAAPVAGIGTSVAAIFAIGAVVELSPQPDSTQLFAAAVLVAILATRTALLVGARGVVVALALLVQLQLAWTSVRVTYAMHLDAKQRIALLRRAAPGSTAVVPAYRRNHANGYVYGDDFRLARLRDRVASEVFGLRAIAIEPALYGAEPTPRIEYRAPGMAWLSGDLATSRRQAHGEIATDLEVDGRPVLAAWGDAQWLELEHHGIPPFGTDELGRVHLRGAAAGARVVAIDLATRKPVPISREDGDVVLARDHGRQVAVVACDAQRCALGAIEYLP